MVTSVLPRSSYAPEQHQGHMSTRDGKVSTEATRRRSGRETSWKFSRIRSPPFETELALIVYQLIVDIAAFPRFSSLAWPSA